MAEEKTSKIKDIKETVSGAVEIIRQIRTPGVHESLENIMYAAMIAKEIIEALRTPEMVRNIENCRLISENIKDASAKMQEMLKQLEQKGITDEVKGLIKSARNTTDSFDNTVQDVYEISNAVRKMFKSVRGLVEELRANTVS